MKILTGAQIREADRYTIEHEPIASIDLMERAAGAIAAWVCRRVAPQCPLLVFAGKGNNGGDGLAAARILYHAGYDCTVVQLFDKELLSPDCAANLQRLPAGVRVVRDLDGLEAGRRSVLIDALLGTGVSEAPLDGVLRQAVEFINASSCRVVSIDLPSGMRTEFGNTGRAMVQADITLTLQFPKLAQLLPEAGGCCGELVVLPIGLDPQFLEASKTPYHFLTREMVHSLLEPRPKFSHKGTYGHALLVAGSEGMMGAAVLATGAALRSGCGLVTAHVPRKERSALQCTLAGVMLSLDPADRFTTAVQGAEHYDAIGVGPGLGTAEVTVFALQELLQQANDPMVVDADALNILAAHPAMLATLPMHSILTPHPGELRRLVGEWSDSGEKLHRASRFARDHNVILLVKGAHTVICYPTGTCLFNSTGTPAMAKGGSGDVLTGLLTGLLARGYDPFDAAALGVWLHGLAGEKGEELFGAEALSAADLIDMLPAAMQELAAGPEE